MLLYAATGIYGAGGTPNPTPAPTGLLALFRLRYPVFAAVSDDGVNLWLDEGMVETATWEEATRERAAMLYAAHQLALQGLDGGAPAGATSFKSGTFSMTFSDGAASRTGFRATAYGRDYLDLARRQFAGPRLAWNPPAMA